jgi:hypothetical protein
MLWHTARMPDDHPKVSVIVSTQAIAERLAQLPTRKEMWRAVLLGTTTGACLVQCLAWLLRLGGG